MSAIVCSLSGSPLVEGVVSTKTGHVYEKSTIVKHIHVYGTCPHTQQPLSIADLLPINCKQSTITHSQFLDTERLISKIQQEYQSIVLETYELKSRLSSSREELALSLYKQDASIRVIAKLKDQVKANREEIAKMIAEIRSIETGNV